MPNTISSTLDLRGDDPCGCSTQIAAAEGHYCRTGPLPAWQATITFLDKDRVDHIHTVRGPNPVQNRREIEAYALAAVAEENVLLVAVKEVR